MKQLRSNPKILITARGVTLSAGMWMKITGIEGGRIRKAFADGKNMDEFLFGGWVNGVYASSKAQYNGQPKRVRNRSINEVIDVKDDGTTVYEEAARPKQLEATGKETRSKINYTENQLVDMLSKDKRKPNIRIGKSKDEPEMFKTMILKGKPVPEHLLKPATNIRHMTLKQLREERLAILAAIKDTK